MLETMLMLAAAITAAIEFTKSVLVKFNLFATLDEQAQSIILQVFAFIFGIVAAFSWNINLFPQAPGSAGIIITGLIASTGSAGIHVLLALLGVRVGVVADLEFREDTSPQAAGVSKRKTYAPFQ